MCPQSFFQASVKRERLPISRAGNHHPPAALSAVHWRFVMQTFLGMILGAVLLSAGIYVYDSMSTSTVANETAANDQTAQTGRTIVNWDVASNDWHALKERAHDEWVRLSSK